MQFTVASLMSADEGPAEPPIPDSPSLECLGGEGAASEQEASFQMAVWNLLHDAPDEPPSEDDLLHDAPEEPPIEDEPQSCLPDSILEEELERAWYSQAEDTEVKRSSSIGKWYLLRRWICRVCLSLGVFVSCPPLRRLCLPSWRLAPSGGEQSLQMGSRIRDGVSRPPSFLGKWECGARFSALALRETGGIHLCCLRLGLRM